MWIIIPVQTEQKYMDTIEEDLIMQVKIKF